MGKVGITRVETGFNSDCIIHLGRFVFLFIIMNDIELLSFLCYSFFKNQLMFIRISLLFLGVGFNQLYYAVTLANRKGNSVWTYTQTITADKI